MKFVNFNSSGNIMVQVLMLTAAMGVSFYILSSKVIQFNQVANKTANVVNVKFTLNSAMDYVIFGIRQKYCFTDVSLLNDSPSDCNLKHTGSVERLIMPQLQKDVIFQLTLNKNITLDRITRYLRIGDISSTHPLFPVIQGLKFIKGDDGKPVNPDGLSVDIIRDRSPQLPTSGSEAFVNVIISLKKNKAAAEAIKIGNTKLTVQSQLTIYPREVGSFALLVPHDLFLDRAYYEKLPEIGDVSFHNFQGRSDLGTSPGLVFTSPVFVNNDIHLPVFDPNKPNYTGVTFSGRVYLGNGIIQSNQVPFSPLTSGANSDLHWSALKTFGGFNMGIENDGGLDQGLVNLSKGTSTLTTTSIDTALMNQCIDILQANASVEILNQASLGGWLKATNGNSFDYRLSLTNSSQFNPQSNDLRTKDNNWTRNLGGNGNGNRNGNGNGNGNAAVLGDGSLSISQDLVKSGNAVIELTVLLGTKSIRVQLPMDGTLTLTAPVGSPAYLAKLNSAVDTAKAALAAAPTAADTVAAQGVLDRAQGALAAFNSALNAPPSIVITTSSVGTSPAPTAPDKLNINFKFDNTSSFIDASGIAISPTIMIQAYDGTFNFSQPITNNTNSNLLNSLKFNFNPLDPAPLAPPVTSIAGVPITFLEPTTDSATLHQLCQNARDNQTSQSLGSFGLLADFSANTRHSWNFSFFDYKGPVTKGANTVMDELKLSGLVRKAGGQKFFVDSIVGKCIITKTSDFVAGFFNCDELVIEKRDTPLRIIGTFIVNKKLTIDPSAFESGITWSSIYEPQATQELRAVGILSRKPSNDCNQPRPGSKLALKDNPIWHPSPSIQEVSDRMSCNVISLRAQADPFQWTSVDPDCGLIPGKPKTTCKRRLVRFFVVEQSRELGQ